MGFWGSKPSPSSLRDAISPERGRFYAAKRQMQRAPPSGELSSVCETERASPLNLLQIGFFFRFLFLAPGFFQLSKGGAHQACHAKGRTCAADEQPQG